MSISGFMSGGLLVVHRLNWQLHFGDPPKWAPDVRFILVDVEPSQRDADKAEVVLRGDAAAVAQQLQSSLTGLDSARSQAWRDQLASKVRNGCHVQCKAALIFATWCMHCVLERASPVGSSVSEILCLQLCLPGLLPPLLSGQGMAGRTDVWRFGRAGSGGEAEA